MEKGRDICSRASTAVVNRLQNRPWSLLMKQVNLDEVVEVDRVQFPLPVAPDRYRLVPGAEDCEAFICFLLINRQHGLPVSEQPRGEQCPLLFHRRQDSVLSGRVHSSNQRRVLPQ